jgi:hypothetical protein
MKILVATKASQGTRKSDFNWTDEGELVEMPCVCSRGCASNPDDDSCGCGRSFGGLLSFKATTTAKVIETDMSRDEYIAAHALSECKAGWEPSPATVAHWASVMLNAAKRFKPGDIVENRGGQIKLRMHTFG